MAFFSPQKQHEFKQPAYIQVREEGRGPKEFVVEAAKKLSVKLFSVVLLEGIERRFVLNVVSLLGLI